MTVPGKKKIVAPSGKKKVTIPTPILEEKEGVPNESEEMEEKEEKEGVPSESEGKEEKEGVPSESEGKEEKEYLPSKTEKKESLDKTAKAAECTRYRSFDDMKLSDGLLRGIYAYGFEKPSEIQQQAICAIMTGRDVVGQAQSGTGKTGAFTIGSLQMIDLGVKGCQVLILSPTRELAEQTAKVAKGLSDFMKVTTHVCVGGKSTRIDVEALRAGVQLVSGTPGRVYDMIKRGALNLKHLKILILDEADEMLSKGFRDQIYDIFQELPNSNAVQVCLFSATMPDEVCEVMTKFMRNPIKIMIKKELITLEGIKQFYIAVEKEEHKFETLIDLYETMSVVQCIIYVNTRRKVEWLGKQMAERDHVVSIIHGDLKPEDRTMVMQEFRTGFLGCCFLAMS